MKKEGYEQFLETGDSGEVLVKHTSKRTRETTEVIVQLTVDEETDVEKRKMIWIDQMGNFSQ